MIALALLLSCASPPPPPPPPDLLGGPRLARRISLDLRGVLPSAEELDLVEQDPAALSTLVDGWLDDPRLEERLVQWLADRWWTKVDSFDATPEDFGLSHQDEAAFAEAVGEEPLRLMARVAVLDQPWTEILSTDTTMANPLLASIWPLERLEEGDGWTPARYTDGRPAAGVLASNGLWWRYTTNESNMNRGRAASLLRLLTCEDLLARPVSFSAAEADLSDLSEAVRTEPVCLSCHAGLDPVAAGLFGFWWLTSYSAVEMTWWHPEREAMAEDALGTTPAWAGTPVFGLEGLGAAIASDSRFSRCAVETFAAALWGREPEVADDLIIENLRQDFINRDQKIRPLIKALLNTPAYASSAEPRLLSAAQLSGAVEDLTGLQWRWQETPLLANDTLGYRVLAGGVDGQTTFQNARQPGLSWALVVQRLAEAGAASAVADGRVDAGLAPGDPAFGEALQDLHWRLTGRRADPTWLLQISLLWQEVADEEGAEAAWRAALTAMLRDPDFVSE